MALKLQTFGEALKLALSQAKMRQIDLASKTGLPMTTITNISKDKAKPTDEQVKSFEQAIGLEPGTLRAFAKKSAVKS